MAVMFHFHAEQQHHMRNDGKRALRSAQLATIAMLKIAGAYFNVIMFHPLAVSALPN